ncbi:transposase [Blastomonas natatoria]|uniref:transposase n=1 Tax=Blastomonas natatoria TaxID=34015 RepID=UPI003CC5A382
MGEDLRSHILDLDRKMRTMAASIPVCARFQTIPGVGTITALSFYSAVGDPYRFRSNRDVGPYLGLTPNLYQSGATARRGRISRYGNKRSRPSMWCRIGCGQRAAFSGGLGCNL